MRTRAQRADLDLRLSDRRYGNGWTARLRGRLVIVLTCVAVLMAAAATGAVPAQRALPASVPVVENGLYESCKPSDPTTCAAHFTQMVAGGFTLVINYAQLDGSGSQVQAYMDSAQAHGIRVEFALNDKRFWDGSDPRIQYSALAAGCGCTAQTFIDYIVNLVKGKPALAGYYVGDEVATSQQAAWLAHSNRIHADDPAHTRLIVMGSSAPAVNANLASFANGAETLGQDFYPTGAEFDHLGTYRDTGTVASQVAAVATRTHRASAMVLQAFTWQDYAPPQRCAPYPACAPFPSEAHLQTERDLAVGGGVTTLFWYSYFDMFCCGRTGGAQHWADLVQAVNAPLPGQPPPRPHPRPRPRPSRRRDTGWWRPMADSSRLGMPWAGEAPAVRA